jgi:mxaD protein
VNDHGRRGQARGGSQQCGIDRGCAQAAAKGKDIHGKRVSGDTPPMRFVTWRGRRVSQLSPSIRFSCWRRIVRRSIFINGEIIMKSFIPALTGAACLTFAASSFAGGSLSVSRELTVDRAPETVWKLLGEFNALDVWLPPVQRSSFKGKATKPGAVRVLDLGNDASVTEELLAYNDAGHSYRYAFLKSPLPVKNYVATIELSAASGGKTLVKWHSTFDASGAPDDTAKAAVQGIYDAGLGKLATIFKN